MFKLLYVLIPTTLVIASCSVNIEHDVVVQENISQISLDSILTKEQLGEFLFKDPKMSQHGDISCASCHIPSFAFADTVALSLGTTGKKGKRNTPSVVFMADRDIFFYDGRAKDIFDQVHFPVEDSLEMNFTIDQYISLYRSNRSFSRAFKRIYGAPPSDSLIADAIAHFEISLDNAETRYDNYMSDIDTLTFTEQEKRGLALFNDPRNKCFDCHFGPDFTGDEFRNIGLFDGKTRMDSGRYLVTKNIDDIGKFKVPSLRNVAVTAPYMHDGSFKTLEDVMAYYSDPYKFVDKPINMDTLMLQPLNLSDKEQADIIAFLKSLTDNRYLNH